VTAQQLQQQIERHAVLLSRWARDGFAHQLAIIDAYGGCIDLENAAAGGSIVRVTLPAGDQMDQVR
jgi:hypothetical protein